MDQFNDVNIIEILKVGLSGLVFLLFCLAYRLLQLEQKKQRPRKSILKAIDRFLLASIFSTLIVGGINLSDIFIKNSITNKKDKKEKSLSVEIKELIGQSLIDSTNIQIIHSIEIESEFDIKIGIQQQVTK